LAICLSTEQKKGKKANDLPRRYFELAEDKESRKNRGSSWRGEKKGGRGGMKRFNDDEGNVPGLAGNGKKKGGVRVGL